MSGDELLGFNAPEGIGMPIPSKCVCDLGWGFTANLIRAPERARVYDCGRRVCHKDCSNGVSPYRRQRSLFGDDSAKQIMGRKHHPLVIVATAACVQERDGAKLPVSCYGC